MPGDGRPPRDDRGRATGGGRHRRPRAAHAGHELRLAGPGCVAEGGAVPAHRRVQGARCVLAHRGAHARRARVRHRHVLGRQPRGRGGARGSRARHGRARDDAELGEPGEGGRDPRLRRDGRSRGRRCDRGVRPHARGGCGNGPCDRAPLRRPRRHGRPGHCRARALRAGRGGHPGRRPGRRRRVDLGCRDCGEGPCTDCTSGRRRAGGDLHTRGLDRLGRADSATGGRLDRGRARPAEHRSRPSERARAPARRGRRRERGADRRGRSASSTHEPSWRSSPQPRPRSPRCSPGSSSRCRAPCSCSRAATSRPSWPHACSRGERGVRPRARRAPRAARRPSRSRPCGAPVRGAHGCERRVPPSTPSRARRSRGVACPPGAAR